MVRNFPVTISPIYMLKNDTLFNRLFELNKINLLFEGVFYSRCSATESVPFKHVLTQENYNSEAYANAFERAQVNLRDGACTRV